MAFAHIVATLVTNAFQIFVGQKIHKNQCRVNSFEVFLRTVTLHQIIAT